MSQHGLHSPKAPQSSLGIQPFVQLLLCSSRRGAPTVCALQHLVGITPFDGNASKLVCMLDQALLYYNIYYSVLIVSCYRHIRVFLIWKWLFPHQPWQRWMSSARLMMGQLWHGRQQLKKHSNVHIYYIQLHVDLLHTAVHLLHKGHSAGWKARQSQNLALSPWFGLG